MDVGEQAMKVTEYHTANHMYVNIKTEDREYSCIGPSDCTKAQVLQRRIAELAVKAEQIGRERALLVRALKVCT